MTLNDVINGRAFAHENKPDVAPGESGPEWKTQGIWPADELGYHWGPFTLQNVPQLYKELGAPPIKLQKAFSPDGVCSPHIWSLGHNGSGLVWHQHGAAINHVIYGRKRWWLSNAFPPGGIDEVLASAAWVEEVWSTIPEDDKAQVHSCVVEPGEAMYVPDSYYHQTLNLGQVSALTYDCQGLADMAELNSRHTFSTAYDNLHRSPSYVTTSTTLIFKMALNIAT